MTGPETLFRINIREARIGYSLIIPFHSDIERLAPTLERVRTEGPTRQIDETLLCHNGSPLNPEKLKIVESLTSKTVRYLHTDAKGIGAGYKLGIENAKSTHVILSASDLPFGWTDLAAFEAAGKPNFAIGSKAHRDSKLQGITIRRRFVSFGFYVFRMLVLGGKTPGDSQGSFILKAELAKALAPLCQYDNYLFTLELCTVHLQKGGKITEVPIVVENNEGESSVSVSRDGLQMAKDLLQLRRRRRKSEA